MEWLGLWILLSFLAAAVIIAFVRHEDPEDNEDNF